MSCFNEAFLALAKDQSLGVDVKPQARICAQYKIAVLLLQVRSYLHHLLHAHIKFRTPCARIREWKYVHLSDSHLCSCCGACVDGLAGNFTVAKSRRPRCCRCQGRDGTAFSALKFSADSSKASCELYPHCHQAKHGCTELRVLQEDAGPADFEGPDQQAGGAPGPGERVFTERAHGQDNRRGRGCLAVLCRHHGTPPDDRTRQLRHLWS